MQDFFVGGNRYVAKLAKKFRFSPQSNKEETFEKSNQGSGSPQFGSEDEAILFVGVLIT